MPLRVAARTPERFGRLALIGVDENAFRRDDTSALADIFKHDNTRLSSNALLESRREVSRQSSS